MPTNYTKIRTLADQRGTTIGHISVTLGKDRSYLSAMERKGYDLSPENLLRVAEFLGTTTDYLAGVTDDPAQDYLVRQADSPEERLVHLLMLKIPEMTDGQVAALSRLFLLEKQDFDTMIAPLEVWGK
jgi:transcriptional regulator with XRE-family HTH domain